MLRNVLAGLAHPPGLLHRIASSEFDFRFASFKAIPFNEISLRDFSGSHSFSREE